MARERSAETSATRERFTVSGGGGVAAATVSGMRVSVLLTVETATKRRQLSRLDVLVRRRFLIIACVV